jgi:hypothetical protein
MRCSSLIFGNSNAVYFYSTGYSPHNVIPDQPSKNQSPPTETSITSSKSSTPPVADGVVKTTPHPTDSAARDTVFEARPFDTQTEKCSGP